MIKLIDYLSRQPKPVLLAIGIIFVILIGYVNHMAGVEMSASILYLIPVSMVSWCLGRREGTLIALTSSVSWYVAEWYAGRDYSHPILYYWNLAVMFGFFLTVNFALSGLRKALEKEKKLARIDPLTGVANARYFSELAGKEIARSRRYKHPLTLVYLDCDNFKTVNDQFGHQTGNRVLRILASSLLNSIRATDLVARLGGDEFAILMPETGRQVAPLALKRLQTRLVDALLEDGWPVTLSMGAAIYLHPPDSVDELIKSADRLMFLAKNEGKNTVQYKIYTSPGVNPESLPPEDSSTHSLQSAAQSSDLPAV